MTNLRWHIGSGALCCGVEPRGRAAGLGCGSFGGGVFHDAEDWVAEDEHACGERGVVAISDDGADQKEDGAGEGDAGGVWVAPGAVGAGHVGLFLAEGDERGVGERVVGDKEEREHGDDAFE